jgi:hypothetical protein
MKELSSRTAIAFPAMGDRRHGVVEALDWYGRRGARPAHIRATCWLATTTLDHDPIRLIRIMTSSRYLSMIFSENRSPLLRIML